MKRGMVRVKAREVRDIGDWEAFCEIVGHTPETEEELETFHLLTREQAEACLLLPSPEMAKI